MLEEYYEDEWEKEQREKYDMECSAVEAAVGRAEVRWQKEQEELMDTHECANCGRKGTLLELEEATRRGFGLGEWYCHRGEGCCSTESGVS